jgi:hypothetical protein
LKGGKKAIYRRMEGIFRRERKARLDWIGDEERRRENMIIHI